MVIDYQMVVLEISDIVKFVLGDAAQVQHTWAVCSTIDGSAWTNCPKRVVLQMVVWRKMWMFCSIFAVLQCSRNNIPIWHTYEYAYLTWGTLFYGCLYIVHISCIFQHYTKNITFLGNYCTRILASLGMLEPSVIRAEDLFVLKYSMRPPLPLSMFPPCFCSAHTLMFCSHH